MSIQLTVEAAEQLRKVIAEQNLSLSEMSLRVGFKGRATDRQYTLDLDENTRPDDRRFESNGVTVVCRAEDLPILDETTIDFKTVAGTPGGFTFNVPEKEHVTHGADSGEHPPPTQEQVRQALYKVDDPEVGVNIIDLGLVFDLELQGRDVRIRMTLTTPACPLEEHIRGEIDQRVREVCPGVDSIGVTIVWQPKWTPELMTPEGKKQLGWSR
jgi:metal-sulfur cluster biosynthetic enzyme/Fe-S cluster assembly iron-binding protein IscA